MTRKKILIAAVLTIAVAGLIAAPAIAQRVVEKEIIVKKGGCSTKDVCVVKSGHGKGMMPEFTAEQEKQIGKIKEKYEQERVALANRMKAMHIEVKDLLDKDAPDFKALEKKIDEFSKVHADQAKLRLRQHQEIRGLLDADQQTILDAGFMRRMHGLLSGGMGHGGRGGCGGKMGGGMGCGMGGGMHGGMMGGRMMGKMGCDMGGMMGAPGTTTIIEMHMDDEMDMDHDEDGEEHGEIDIHELHQGVDPGSM